MISGNDINVRKATENDIEAIKEIADAHRHELGFVLRPALLEAIARAEVFVAQHQTNIIGFIEYRHRRDEQTTLYNIVVKESFRSKEAGRQLMNKLENEATERKKSFILLKCPRDLPANAFYEHLGYQKVKEEKGKARRLNIWQKHLT